MKNIEIELNELWESLIRNHPSYINNIIEDKELCKNILIHICA